MKKSLQLTLISLLLLLPLCLITFLYLFGENSYQLGFPQEKSLRVYNPKTNDCHSTKKTHTIPSFQFISQEGKVYHSDKLKGKTYVANFFFTICPSICPKMTTELRRVQEFYRHKPDLQLVSFSVDPTHDSPEVLAAYAKKYQAEPQKWTFLTGEAQKIYEVAYCGFFLPAHPNPDQKNDFIHSERLTLIDRDGRIRGYYNGTEREDVDRLILEIQILFSEYDRK